MYEIMLFKGVTDYRYYKSRSSILHCIHTSGLQVCNITQNSCSNPGESSHVSVLIYLPFYFPFIAWAVGTSSFLSLSSQNLFDDFKYYKIHLYPFHETQCKGLYYVHSLV